MSSKKQQFIKNFSKISKKDVAMAGGKGARLEPFSKIFPKSLIPIGEKPIIEIVIDEFRKYGVSRYYLVLNYKGEMIESYFNNIEKDYTIKYIREKTNRIIFSFELIILYLIAAAFGFLYNNKKTFLHIIFALFTAILFHEILLGFHGKFSFNSVNHSLSVILSLIVISIPTVFFILKSIKKEDEII